jgi:hypothetical protein
MRRTWLVLLVSLAVVGITASAAIASSVHLKGGKNAEPAFNDGGLTLNAAGELSGLGNGDVLVTLAATADVNATCTNEGQHQAPGQNPAPISVTGSQAIPEGEIKNGNTPFNVTTLAPAPLIPGAPDCPNPNWEEEITDLSFTNGCSQSSNRRLGDRSLGDRSPARPHVGPKRNQGGHFVGTATREGGLMKAVRKEPNEAPVARKLDDTRRDAFALVLVLPAVLRHAAVSPPGLSHPLVLLSGFVAIPSARAV